VLSFYHVCYDLVHAEQLSNVVDEKVKHQAATLSSVVVVCPRDYTQGAAGVKISDK
jgi:hypothetical protein